jgi:hypothetical protein
VGEKAYLPDAAIDPLLEKYKVDRDEVGRTLYDALAVYQFVEGRFCLFASVRGSRERLNPGVAFVAVGPFDEDRGR